MYEKIFIHAHKNQSQMKSDANCINLLKRGTKILITVFFDDGNNLICPDFMLQDVFLY